MLFITRELYEFTQSPELPYEELKQKWDPAVAARLEHHAKIKQVMKNNMKDFMDITLHDGEITYVHRPASDTVALEVDGRHCPWGPRGLFTVTFRGVKVAEGLDECTGATWLYEEVHLHPEANFDYQVLLDKWNVIRELRIVADEVEFEIIEASPPPVIGVNIPFTAAGGMYVWTELDESGTAFGWCCITDDGRKVAKALTPELREKLRSFAEGIGAIMPDETT